MTGENDACGDGGGVCVFSGVFVFLLYCKL
jgi:hypothetical protein